VALSGGIDSALVAAIATEALGAENVVGIGMPSPYSSAGSVDDSRRLAANLGIRFEVIGISGLLRSLHALWSRCCGNEAGYNRGNIQSRIRGDLVMALSNKFPRWCSPPATNRKWPWGTALSMATWWRTGGDWRSGEDPRLRCLPRINRDSEVIPRTILEKPPSAELRPDQKDTDSLPPTRFSIPFSKLTWSAMRPRTNRSGTRISLQLVQQVVRLVERSEYKRQQSARF